jgi:transcriptional antiterminator NusG
MENVEKKWYVVNTYSGHENKVKINLERRIESLDMQDYIYRVVVAEHPEPVLKDGMPTDKVKMKNTYPGYLFVEMYMTDRAWYVVRNTPGVTGFIGSSGRGAKPFPVPKEQIETVLKSVGMADESMFDDYQVGDKVKILRGPLMGGEGTIQSVDANKRVLKVSSIFFGRETLVEVDFSDVDKVKEK